jgi:hypothetical protein
MSLLRRRGYRFRRAWDLRDGENDNEVEEQLRQHGLHDLEEAWTAGGEGQIDPSDVRRYREPRIGNAQQIAVPHLHDESRELRVEDALFLHGPGSLILVRPGHTRQRVHPSVSDTADVNRRDARR